MLANVYFFPHIFPTHLYYSSCTGMFEEAVCHCPSVSMLSSSASRMRTHQLDHLPEITAADIFVLSAAQRLVGAGMLSVHYMSEGIEYILN